MVKDRSDMKTELDNCVFEEYIQEIHYTPPLAKTEDLGAFTLDISKFSTVLVFEDENGTCIVSLCYILRCLLCIYI